MAWARGRLNYKLRSAQKKIEAKYREVQERGGKLLFVNCSRRIGKTYWAVKKSIEVALRCKNANPRIKIGSAYFEDLKEFIIPSFEQILEDCPRNAIPWRWLGSQKKYLFPAKGAEIKLVGLDLKPNGLRGTYADLIVLEECGFMRQLDYLYSSVCVPMTMYRPGAMIVMIGTPPRTPDHPFILFMEKAKAADAYIELTIDDNEELTPQERQSYLDECLTETDRLREYFCKCVVDSNRAIVPEWRDECAVEVPRDEFFQYYQPSVAMDLGVVDQTVDLFGYYDFRRAALIVEDELVMQGPEMTTDKLAESIRAKEAELWGEKPVWLRVSDNDNLLLLQDLAAKHGLAFTQVQKTSLEAMVNEVRMWARAGRILVNPRCKTLLGCLRAGIWDERRTQFERSTIFGHFDALAALVYWLRMLNSSANPIPPTHGRQLTDSFISPQLLRNDSGDVKALKKAFRLNR